MPQHHKIDTGFYCQDVYFIFANGGKEASDYINLEWENNEDDVDMLNTCRGFQWKTTFNNGKYLKARFFIFIHPSDLGNSTVDHEIIHLTWDILSHLGLKLSNSNHEAFTYFYEHLINQVKKLISEQVQPASNTQNNLPT